MSELDYNDLDPGIRSMVRSVRRAGMETFASCQGTEGHAFDEPVVRCWRDGGRSVPEQLNDLRRQLRDDGFEAFIVRYEVWERSDGDNQEVIDVIFYRYSAPDLCLPKPEKSGRRTL